MAYAECFTRRAFLTAAGTLLAMPALAQQQNRIPRVAYLSANPPGDYRSEALRDGLRDLGYTEGTDILIDYFLAPTIADLPEWAAKAVASTPDLIVAINGPAALAAKSHTTSIPIVASGITNPVEIGLVESFARPGGNVTGPSMMISEVAAKRLQMLSEIIPGLARVAVMYQAEDIAGAAAQLDETRLAGETLGIDIRTIGVKTGPDLASTIASAAAEGAQAIYLQVGPILPNNLGLIADAVARVRLPSISDNRILPEAGGLLSYGANVPASFRRAAYYVDRILKGANPAELPVEQPRELELVINKRTADTLGLTIPPKLMILATQIIE